MGVWGLLHTGQLGFKLLCDWERSRAHDAGCVGENHLHIFTHRNDVPLGPGYGERKHTVNTSKPTGEKIYA